ncbi:MAG: hypothetical protein GY761_14945 [Hyphomicrobiales bacterium]|nr:hypothetical protein [Hyphomicrobiales bacterium]
MTDNVIDLPVPTSLDLDPDKILQQAVGNLDSAVVIGWKKEGELYFASSMAAKGVLTTCSLHAIVWVFGGGNRNCQ